MRNIFTSPDSARVGYYCSILKEAGINAFVRNDNVSGAEVMIPAFYPSVCIIEDDRYDEAIEIIARHKDAPIVSGPDWTCPQCHETVPDSFDSCWNCETNRPGESTATDIAAAPCNDLQAAYLAKAATMRKLDTIGQIIAWPLAVCAFYFGPRLCQWSHWNAPWVRFLPAAIAASVLLITSRIIRRLDRQRGFQCPACGTSLTLGQDTDQIAASRLCPECEAPVFQTAIPS